MYISLYLLTRSIRVLLEKLTGSQQGTKFPTFYGTRRFITVFTCPYPEPARSSPYHQIHFLKINLYIFPSKPGSPKWALSLRCMYVCTYVCVCVCVCVYIYIYIYTRQVDVGRVSSVGITTRYGLDGPEIESRLGRDKTAEAWR